MKTKKRINILGIDTSCDETSLAIIQFFNKKLKILSNIVSSQARIHSKYGGVFPSLAKREHIKNLPIVFQQVFLKAKKPKIDFIAVTIGPGLEICLWQGINFAKNLAKKMNVPIIPVNHIEAHIFSSFLEKKNYRQLFSLKIFPAISLIISGGHTELILVEKIGKYKVVGQTRDDAAGECLDKTARLLGLGYPGGPAIEKLAKKASKKIYYIQLPRPMIHQKNYDFSFAGLKTAVLYDFLERKKEEKESIEYKEEMAKEIQEAVIEVLLEKTMRAVKEFRARSLILGGGVVANKELRKKFFLKTKKYFPKVKLFFPSVKYSTDNGAMVALVGFFHLSESTQNLEKVYALPNLNI